MLSFRGRLKSPLLHSSGCESRSSGCITFGEIFIWSSSKVLSVAFLLNAYRGNTTLSFVV